MSFRLQNIVLIGLLQALITCDVVADAERAEYFELHIRPLFAERCVGCHSGRQDAKSRLEFGSREQLLAGGDFGPALVPGSAESSLLVQAVRRIHKELHMPPKAQDRLSAAQIERLVKWINDGASWGKPSGAGLTEVPVKEVKKLDGSHWSLQPRRVVLPPTPVSVASRWNESAIDRFVQAARREQKLKPVESADRRTLLRRASFDLIGLPPRPDEVKSFLDDPRPDVQAFAAVVDRLLASPHHGERWGRHWLDVARYADTQGDVGDFPIPSAYLYRNWVIDALNRDMPYDVFIRRQLAGDIVARNLSDPSEVKESIVATGFIALSRRFGNSKADDMNLTIEDTLDTVGRGVLGLTLRCARCHDHKFDPILTTDYYGLYGVFESTRYPWMGASNQKSPSDLSPVTSDPAAARRVREFFDLISHYEYQMNNHFRPWLKPTLDAFKRNTSQLASARKSGAKTDDLEKQRETLLGYRGGKFRELMLHGLSWVKKEKARMGADPGMEMVFAVGEGKPGDSAVHLRGNRSHKGAVVKRRTPKVFGGNTLKSSAGSGRLELAEWLTRPDHPLTARVIVNRVWHHHFGRGLVATPDNFGKLGEPPSHPELLDWLADRFVNEDGWSLKKLHRRILLSRTWQLSSTSDQRNLSIDPDNQFLWRHSRRRLDAESIRDGILQVSLRLDSTPGTAHPFAPWYVKRYSLNGPFNSEFQTLRRSVYLMTQRLFRHSFLGLFDGPDTMQTTATRGSVNIPGQALYLMHSSFVRDQSLCFADRVLEQPMSDSDRLRWMWQRAYARDPRADEIEQALQHLGDYERLAKDRRHLHRNAWAGIARVLLTSNEFFFVD
jgi:mono/diheme cytochrome c family protein